MYFSTNGTIVNSKTRLKKNEKVDLNVGDVVHLVKKKSTDTDGLCFLFSIFFIDQFVDVYFTFTMDMVKQSTVVTDPDLLPIQVNDEVFYQK